MTTPVSSVGSSVPTLASALKGYETQVSTTASNIANVESTGYKAFRANAVSMAPGMRVAVQPTGQEVDTTSQLVDLTTASESYQAAAAALGSISRTEKRSLDLIG
ncbi:flagellar basal body protein [Telmatospirillum siberiense]|nr:flagellar basal body protein [Telmatospirillum siberiense]